MSNTRGLGPWVFVAAVTAAIVGPGYSRQPANTAPAPPAKAAPSNSPENVGAGSDDNLDTLDTIAASLAVDTTNDGLRRRALFSLRLLGSPGPTRTEPQRVAIGYLTALFRLPLRPIHSLAPARDAMTILTRAYADGSAPSNAAGEIGTAVRVVDEFFDRYFDSYALSDKSPTKDAVLLAKDFDQLDKSDLKVELLRVMLQSKNNIEFLITTLPDPIDSYTGWQFDPMLEAITQAVSANDYVLDRSHFPDSDKEEAGATNGTQHELEPGVVVFRRLVDRNALDELEYGNRLVLLIVHENPAAGIHVRALANAMRLVVRCRALTPDRVKPGAVSQPDPTIRILGPTFSGSSETLTRALLQVQPRLPTPYTVRVLSGSATDSRNKETIESASGSLLKATFKATVHPDDVLLPKMVNELGWVGWSRRMAVLFEANTQYGRQVGNAFWQYRFGEAGKLGLINLPFPMNISRLRTTVQTTDTAGTGLLGLPSRFRHLEMEAKGNPADLIPQFNPKTSAAYMELALAALFRTIQREDVKTVALMATDSRDKLFLAQELSRYAPDVSIFTAESDSLYIHPDYSSFLRGTMVVSTYPLQDGIQRWSSDEDQDGVWGQQFANGSAQGVYNATLALLAYDADGQPVRDDPPRLREYGFPGEGCASACRPPVWISVVGNGGIWPVRAYKADLNDEYVFPVSALTRAVPLAVFPSVSFHVLIALLAAALLTGLILQVRNGPQILAAPAGQTPDRAQAALGYLFAGLTAVLIAQAVLFGLCAMRVRVGDRTLPAVAALATTAVGLIPGVLMIARVLLAIGSALPSRAREGWSQRRSTWLGAVTAVVLAWSVWNLTTYGLGYLFAERSQVLSFLARAVDFGNGVSPAMPILFLCFAFAVWAGTEVARVRRGRVALADVAVHPVVQEMIYGNVQSLKEPWGLLNRSLISVPWSGVALVAAAGAATCIFAFNPFTSLLVTIEGPRFGRFVSITLLLVQAMLGLGLVQFGYLWYHIRRLLHLMARHPLAVAYDRVPTDLFPTTVFPRPTRLVDLQLAVTHADRVLAELNAGPGAPAPAPITTTYEREMRTTPDLHWAASQSWTGLLNAASLCASRLRLPLQSAGTGPAGSPETAVAAGNVAVAVADAVIERQAEVPAMVTALVVRDALVRLAHNLTFVITGILLVFASYTLFPFQQHTDLQVLGWIDIGIAFATILTVLVQIKRNPIIASLTTPAGAPKTTWDTDFVLKVAVFGLLPLLTLFAAQFPDVGGVILHWLEPVQKALP